MLKRLPAIGDRRRRRSTYSEVTLTLEDGSVFKGRSFGAEVPPEGTLAEVVFQTGMVGRRVDVLTTLPRRASRGHIFSSIFERNRSLCGRETE